MNLGSGNLLAMNGFRYTLNAVQAQEHQIFA